MKIHKVLIKARFRRPDHERRVYYKTDKDSRITVAMCVDYFIIFLSNKREKDKLKKNLIRRLKMKDIGEAKQYLSMRIQTGKIK
jgi:hypothetical protein